MIVNVVVLMWDAYELNDVPARATVQWCLDRASKKAWNTLTGKVRINWADVTDLDSEVTDGTNIIIQPEAGQVKNWADETENPVLVSFVQVVERKLIDNKTLTDKIKVGAVLRDYLGLDACGTNVTLNWEAVSQADYLQSGTYHLEKCACGDEDEDETDEDEDDDY